MKLYFNGTLVWSGIYNGLASGNVGVWMYRDSTVGSLYVDYATLSSIGADTYNNALADMVISAEQRALNDAADAEGQNPFYYEP